MSNQNTAEKTTVTVAGIIYDLILDVCEMQGTGETRKSVKIGEVTEHWQLNEEIPAGDQDAQMAALTEALSMLEWSVFANRFNYGHAVQERSKVKNALKAKDGTRAKDKEKAGKLEKLIALARKEKSEGNPDRYNELIALEIIKE